MAGFLVLVRSRRLQLIVLRRNKGLGSVFKKAADSLLLTFPAAYRPFTIDFIYEKTFIPTLILLLAIIGYVAWLVIGPTTGFAENVKYLYIPSDSARKDLVLQIIERDSIVGNPTIFSLVANRLDYWKNIKPGKYKIEKGYSALKIARELHNGKQEPVKLVIIKFRTKEALAGAIGRKLEVDSLKVISFLNSNDSLKSFGLDSNTAMSAIFPDTYTYFWNTTTPSKVYRKFYEESKRVWTHERRQKAAMHNLNFY